MKESKSSNVLATNNKPPSPSPLQAHYRVPVSSSARVQLRRSFFHARFAANCSPSKSTLDRPSVPPKSCRHSPTHNIPQHFATLRRGTTEPLPRCLSRSAIRRWTPSPLRKSLSAPRHLFPDTLPLQHSTSTAAMDVPRSNKQPTSTPQNTPANAAPISSRAQQPNVGTIKEGMLHSFFSCVVLLPLQPRALVLQRFLTANLNFYRGA